MKFANICFVFLMVINFHAYSSDFYVSVDGSPDGIGSLNHPWDLQTALDHPKDVEPGDTIWVFGGIYTGVFSSNLMGREGLPVILRAMPNEEVILDGNVESDVSAVLSIIGNNTWYWGLTITNSDSQGRNYFKDGINFLGFSNKLINCEIYNNGGNGVSFWSTATNSEIYGSLIYHNGFTGTSRGHGHGIYSQNQLGTKLIRDNILFNSFGIGLHIYTENGSIEGFVIEGNVIFNSGLPGFNYLDRNILVGGGQPADRISIRNNTIFNRPDYVSKASVQLGYDAANRNAEFSGNTLINGTLYIMKNWSSLQNTRNNYYGQNKEKELIAFDDFQNTSRPFFNYNNYFRGSINNMEFCEWVDFSNQDQNSTFNVGIPEKTNLEISANRYEAGRGHIVVCNWGNDDYVPVNLSSVLKSGQEFQIHDVLNKSGEAVVSGVYSGDVIQLPLDLSDIDLPIREDSHRDQLKHTLPEFGVFLITSVSGVDVSEEADSIQTVPLEIKRCYPNPTVDILAVDFFSPRREIVNVQIIDENGVIAHKEEYVANFGENTLIMNIASLQSGDYIISISDAFTSASCVIEKQEFGFSSPK